MRAQYLYSFQSKYALKKRLKGDVVVPIYKSGQVGSKKWTNLLKSGKFTGVKKVNFG